MRILAALEPKPLLARLHGNRFNFDEEVGACEARDENQSRRSLRPSSLWFGGREAIVEIF